MDKAREYSEELRPRSRSIPPTRAFYKAHTANPIPISIHDRQIHASQAKCRTKIKETTDSPRY
jgi:hypothetical protein